MDRSLAETLMGAFILTVAIAFGVFAYNASGMRAAGDGSYQVVAKFDSVDGIGVGSDVRIGGVKVGVVKDITLDRDSYQAKVALELQSGVGVPKDSTAAIVSESLLGGKYIALTPGGDEENLTVNGEIKFTQSSVNLESLIGRFMFSGGEKGGSGAAAPAAPATPVESKL